MSINTQIQCKKVFVGVSGGVDSSVAAALLKQQGHDVTGVFIKIWHKDLSQCDWRQEMQDAMRVCAALDIPFQMIDLSDVYMQKVISYLIEAYDAGKTPNPDVMCNNSVKFGAFYDWAIDHGAEYVATGHYARVNESGELHKAVDAAKDQSYFLWNVPKDRLKKTLFPIGAYKKPQVRDMAHEFGLPTATKADSQGLCFIGDVDLKSFLQKHLNTKPGDVLDVSGTCIGSHRGAALYTNGERHGFSITTRGTHTLPHYIVGRDLQKNTITVSTDPAQDVTHMRIKLDTMNWFTDIHPAQVDAVFRYHGQSYNASLEIISDTSCVLTLDTPLANISEGQSAVLYIGDQCICGGVIDSAE
jgi:tRNA-uridine 2-sulfurtransferase